MWYIVGLGNPGREYTDTRHNIGFAVCGAWQVACGLPEFVSSSRYSGAVSEGVVHGTEVRILLPHTFMNNSGVAVQKCVPPESVSHLVVVHDDIDLPFGTLRISRDRGDGGHNGLKSIATTLGSRAWVRLRIGIAPVDELGGAKRPTGGGPLERFVLQPFGAHEQEQLHAVLSRAVTALTAIVVEGPEQAMNVYNQ